MHQYQLHRTNDDLDSKCQHNQTVSTAMKKCYWRSLVAPSKAVTNKYEIVMPTPSSGMVKVCNDLPQDITDYLKKVPIDTGDHDDVDGDDDDENSIFPAAPNRSDFQPTSGISTVCENYMTLYFNVLVALKLMEL